MNSKHTTQITEFSATSLSFLRNFKLSLFPLIYPFLITVFCSVFWSLHHHLLLLLRSPCSFWCSVNLSQIPKRTKQQKFCGVLGSTVILWRIRGFCAVICLGIGVLLEMGNQMCVPRKGRHSRRSSRAESQAETAEEQKAELRMKSRRERIKDELLQQQAIAFLLSQQQQQHGEGKNGVNDGSFVFDRSRSHRAPPKHSLDLPRSRSARPRSLADSLVPSVDLLNKDSTTLPDNLESKHIVLVHGGGFGAWCWYKTLALLQETGFKTTAVDLTGSGIDFTDPNNISTLEQYVKPLTDFVSNLGDDEKIIIVGHDFGGTCISYIMELFPSKISKAIFISAFMVSSEQTAYDIIAKEVANSDSLLREAQKFAYSNGSSSPPTAIVLDKDLLKEVLFNQSPAKDVALASVSMRPIPFAPYLEKLPLSEENYGSIRRFFIETSEDLAITPTIQEEIVKCNPPEQIFRIRGSDHCPFFSKPQALHKLLVEIAQIPIE